MTWHKILLSGQNIQTLSYNYEVLEIKPYGLGSRIRDKFFFQIAENSGFADSGFDRKAHCTLLKFN